MNVELLETLVLIESIVYKSNGFAIVMEKAVATTLTIEPATDESSDRAPSLPPV
jgi:hypothetical protein